MKYSNLYKHRVTGQYYKLDKSAKPMVMRDKSFEARLKGITITKYLFRPVKKDGYF